MIKYILTTICMVVCMGFAVQSSAQDFEGIVEVSQQTSDGITYHMKWYIKKDKISYEITSFGAESFVPLRFVPLPEHNKMLMIAAGNRSEIPVKDLVASPTFDTKNIAVREEGGKIIVTTETTVTEVEIDKSVDVSFVPFAAFFKSDYGVYALIKLQQRGFPVSSTTRDSKTGKILSQTTLKKVQATKLDDSLFR